MEKLNGYYNAQSRLQLSKALKERELKDLLNEYAIYKGTSLLPTEKVNAIETVLALSKRNTILAIEKTIEDINEVLKNIQIQIDLLHQNN